MNVTGPAPIANVQRTDENVVAMRVNQRFSAEVLQVAGDRVTLSMDGVRIVARMVASDQTAALQDHRTAQFVVKDASSSTVLLQLVHGEHTPAPGGASVEQELIPNLLRNAGLPVDPATTTIARSLLNNGFQVTPGLVLELQKTLEQLGSWNPAQAQSAAALMALGLPISPETLALVQGNLPALSSLLDGLRAQLRAFIRERSSPEQIEAAKRALAILDGFFLVMEDSGPSLAEKLRQAISNMGHSVERDLARLQNRQTRGQQATGGDGSLMELALLRRDLGNDAPHSLTEKLDRFLDAMRLTQFLNSPPASAPLKGQWLRLDLPLLAGLPQSGADLHLQTARLRVAYHGDEDDSKLDPANTRFLVRVDLETGEWAGQVIQVDVSVAGKRIGAVVTASSDKLRERAEQEIPSLQGSLENMGYLVQVARCDVADLEKTQSVDAPGAWTSFSEISVEA